MKKRFFEGIVTFIVAMSLVFAFVGCKQQSEPVQPPVDEIELSPIGFKITLPASDQTRAGYYSAGDASSYVVNLGMDGETVSSQSGKPGDTLTFTVEKEGTYTIDVFAFNVENILIAEGSATEDISFGEGYVNIVVKLIPKVKPSDPSPDPVDPTPDPVDPSPEPEPTPDPVDPTPDPVDPSPDPEPTPDPVDPTPDPIKKINVGIEIQWAEPYTLTVTTNEYSCFYSYSTSENLGSSVTLEFYEPEELWKIFVANDVEIRPCSYEIHDYRFEYDWQYYDSKNDSYYWQDSIAECSMEITPVFKPLPKVIFNLNGGNINGDTSDCIWYTDILCENFDPQLTREGYALTGWTLTPDGDDIVNKFDEPVTVFAKWSELKYKAEPDKLYLLPSCHWATGDEAYACWFFATGCNGSWTLMTPKESDENNMEGLYEVTIPEGVDNVIFVAYDKTKDLLVDNWDAKFYQTRDLKIPTGDAVLYDISRDSFVTSEGDVVVEPSRFYIRGTMNSWNKTELTDRTYTFFYDGNLEFEIIKDSVWLFINNPIRELDTGYKLEEVGDNITIPCLELSYEYVITLVEKDDGVYITVSKTGNQDESLLNAPKGYFKLTHYAGSMNGWSPDKYALDNNSFTYVSNGIGDQFKFTDGSWSYSIGNTRIDRVDEFELNKGGVSNLDGNGEILLPEGTYKITLVVEAENSAKVVVEALPSDSNNP